MGMESSRMSVRTSVLDTAAGPSLIRADILDPSGLDSVHQRNMPDIFSESNTKLKVSGTVAVQLRMAEAHTLVNLVAVCELVILVLFKTTSINIFQVNTPGRAKHRPLPLPADAIINDTRGQE